MNDRLGIEEGSQKVVRQVTWDDEYQTGHGPSGNLPPGKWRSRNLPEDIVPILDKSVDTQAIPQVDERWAGPWREIYRGSIAED